ncbi:hypothetical protein Gotri_022969, partial [Gossypium trilobum]|nr:hypothetical protein [Gossypium trilobum]
SQSISSIFPTHYHWHTSEFAEPTRILHTYDTVFHGFSASLIETHTASLKPTRALVNSDYGFDVITGVFDIGVWPERRSFADTNLGPIPARWKGVCQTGAIFIAKNCNCKLIGARFFSKGHEAAARQGGPIDRINETIEFISSRDANDHRNHMASTAAGRHAFCASMRGYTTEIAKGIAPKVRRSLQDMLEEFRKNRPKLPTNVILDDGRRLNGVSLYSSEQLKGKMYPLVYSGKFGVLSASLCMENSLDPNVVKGIIVIYNRGSNPKVAKGMIVKEAGGVGMILANGAPNGKGLVGGAHLLPACSLGSDEGDSVKSYVSSPSNLTATVDVKGTMISIKPALISPAAIRSAMMTIASITDNKNQPMIDEATGKLLTSYDFGAGHLNLDCAMDPGLIYDITNHDYKSFLCAIGYNPKLVQVVTRSPAVCSRRWWPIMFHSGGGPFS